MSKKSEPKSSKGNGGGKPLKEEKKAVQQVTVTIFDDGTTQCSSMPQLSPWAVLGLLASTVRSIGG